MPSSTIIWSSARSRRGRRICPESSSLTRVPISFLSGRNHDFDSSSRTHLPVDGQTSANQPCPFLNADQSKPRILIRFDNVEATTIVFNRKLDVPIAFAQSDNNFFGLGVLGHIAKRFLNDPVKTHCNLKWNSIK